MFVKYLNLDVKKTQRKNKDLNWMDDFKVERTYLKLCYDLRDFIQMYEKIPEALLWVQGFYSNVWRLLFIEQIFKNYQCVGWPKDLTKHLFQPSLSNTQLSFRLFKRKLKAWLRAWKDQPSVWKALQHVCYNKAHAVSTSHSIKRLMV